MSRVVTNNDTIRLVPSAYTRSNTSRVTVTNPENMYYNTDHTGAYASIRGRNNTSNVYYAFIHGFNFNDVPTDATINSFAVKIKAYRSSNLSTSNLPRLASSPSNNNTISNTVLSSAFTTDTAGEVYTFPNGSLTWNQIIGYGSNFSIHITLLSTASNSYPYAYVYGAEIEVNYSLQVTQYSVSISNTASGITISPSSQQWVNEDIDHIITFTNVTDVAALKVLDNNVNVSNKLVNIGINTYTYTIKNIDADHTIAVSTVTAYNITASSEVPTLATVDPTSGRTGQGSNYSINITKAEDKNSIRVYDNNVDVTNQLTIGKEPAELSTILNPSSLYSSSTTITNQNNACTNTSSTTYARMPIGQQVANNMIYSFDVSEIPSDATIESVSCVVKASTSTSSNITTKTVQLYSGTTAKGSSSTIPTTTGGTVTLSPGSWTRQELENIRIRFDGYYGGTSSNYNIDFYGADLTIQYTGYIDSDVVKVYTISNVQATHTVVVRENTKYAVTGSSNFSGVSINGLGNVYQDDSIIITLNGITESDSFTLYDNNVDVTSSVNSSYQYTISNVQLAHTLRVEENPHVTISGSSTFTGASFTNLPKKVYESNYGSDFIVNLTGISVPNSFVLTDNGNDVTNFVDNNQYLIQNIEENHTLVLSEATYYSVTGSSSVSGVSITGTSNKVYEGNSITVTITGVSNIYAIKLSDNNVDVSEHIEYVSNSYRYTIEDVHGNHTLTISQQETITVTASSSYSGASLSPTSSTIYKGEPLELTLTVSDITLISVRLTNSQTKIITGIFTDNGNGTYTGVLTDIRENSTVTVIQKVSYTITCTDNSTYGNISPIGTDTVDGGYDVEYKITTEYFNRIYLKDNNTIVNDEIIYNQLIDGSTISYINSYSGASSSGYTNFTTSTSYPISNAGDNSSDTSDYFRLRSTTSNGQHEAWLEFNTSSLNNINIPEDVDLTVTCKVAFRVSSTSYISALAVQLYSGNTPKGSATTTRTTTTTTYTLNVGNDWTVEELQNLRIRITATHNNSTSNGDIRIYGADLTVAYHRDEYYSYTLENISATHTLVLSDRPTYQLTASSTTQTGTITPISSTIYENNNAEFILTVDDITKIRLMDNDADVTDSIIYEDGNFKYIIDSVLGIHTIVLKDKLIVYHKINDQYVAIAKIYKKIAGEWVEQDDVENIFEQDKIYIKRS